MKTSSSCLNRLVEWIAAAGLFRKTCLAVAALLLPGAVFAGNLTGRFATITLDGSLSDWQPGDTLYSASEIAAGAPLNATFTNVLVANDSEYLYVALQIPAPAAITDTWTYNLYIDSDMNSATGFNAGWMVAGYDRLVQYGASGTSYSVFDFAGGAAQANWNWNWNVLINYSYSDSLIEWAIPRSALGMTTNRLRMEFNVTGAGVTTETWAYQFETGVSTYTIASPPDTNAPAITAVDAGPNRAVVTFSKPMDPVTTAVATNYSIGGLSVISATPSGADPKKVTLVTSAQTRGDIYTLSVSRVKDTTGMPIGLLSRKAFVSSILVDGVTDDWDGLSPLFSNPQGNPIATDFQDVYVYNDANYIYFRLTLWEPSDLLSPQNNLFFDTDNNPATGNTYWGGAELLIEAGTGYQEKYGTNFNEGPINGLEWSSANSGSTNYEFRIARSATYASDGLPVFTTNVINFAFEAENSWVTVNQIPLPQGATIPYTLVDVPAAPLGPLAIYIKGGQANVIWTGPGTLQSRGSLSTGAWTNLPSATSPYTVPLSAGQLHFRLAQ